MVEQSGESKEEEVIGKGIVSDRQSCYASDTLSCLYMKLM